ncbi:HEPN domain-containing protein [Schaalia odontolytica]|uniref:HEPN domain-containing protein n=1 Tax=Schaalia odontolytica TaxID=1660 RepID=UPI001D090E26|nr:HEPN domain-containing protein [Schaalia odontolytica]MCB6401424.1 hypothetical protein [Schaalia odontolytica]
MSDLTALKTAAELLSDVDSLLDLHPASKDHKSGTSTALGYGPLLRSGVALCYTAWEVYVEEALVETVEWLLENLEPQELPKAMREWVAKDRPDPWLFVGDSWRAESLRRVRAHIEGDDEGRYGFNAASVGKVIRLYTDILGFDPLSSVTWQNKTNAAVKNGVADLFAIRGEIVHKGATPGHLNLGGARGWVDFVRRLTEKFDACLVEFRTGLTSGGKK